MKIVLIVAFLMILAGILFPLGAWFVDKVKISEVTDNLAAICAAQEAYKAEHRTYHPCKASPANGGTDGIPDPWVDEGTPGTDAFVDIGFRPEGPVRYRYAMIRATKITFTVTARSDLDADGEPAFFVVSKGYPGYPKPFRYGDRW